MNLHVEWHNQRRVLYIDYCGKTLGINEEDFNEFFRQTDNIRKAQ